MKAKLSLLLILLLLLSLSLPMEVEAKDSVIHRIDIHVELQENGEALVTEVWNAEVYQGTEVFLVKSNLRENQMEFTDLQVKDETGKNFRIVERWDPSASREEKTHKAGYNKTNSGVELCFGIGDYGARTYTINYRVKNFLVGYSDGTPGFLVRVINDQMSAPIKEMRVVIEKPGVELNQSNAKIWAFGYEGEIRFEEGKIVAESHQSLGSRNYVNLMASFNPQLFQPAFQNSKSFEEVKDRAMKGSDYENPPDDLPKNFFSRFPFFFILPFFSTGIFMTLALVTAMLTNKGRIQNVGFVLTKESKKKLKEKIKAAKGLYYRDTHSLGSLAENYRILGYTGDAKLQNLISALILSWLRKGYVHLEKEENSKLFGMFKKEETALGGMDLNAPPDPLERKLYDMMVEAAGSDQLLQEKEFYRWSKKEYTRVLKWHEEYIKAAETSLERKREIGKVYTKKVLGILKYDVRDVKDSGIEHAVNLISFKQFLKDFTLLPEREVMEVEVWEEYLIFAALFGIAEKVAEQLEKYQPGIFQDSVYGSDYNSTLYTLSMVNYMSSSVTRASAAASSSSGGGGGFSSSGGGGGFSGGGSGGGFR